MFRRNRGLLLSFVLATVTALGCPAIGETLPSPVLYWPADGSEGVSTRPTFSWAPVAGADRGYQIVVTTRRDALPTDPNVDTCSECVINERTTKPSYASASGTFHDSTTYYWRVQARSSANRGAWSATATFTTAVADLPAPQLLSPPDGGTGQPTVLTFRWSKVEGADLGYVVMIASTPDALPMDPTVARCPDCVVAAAVDGTSYAAGTGVLTDSVTYYWQVRGRSSTRPGGLWSGVSSFTTGVVPGD